MLIDLGHLPAGEENISCGYLSMVIVIRQGDGFQKKFFLFFERRWRESRVSDWHEVKGISFQPQIKFRACVLSRFSHVRLFVTPRTRDSSVHGILQAMILEWVAISFSWGSSQPRGWTPVSYGSCTGRGFLPLALPEFICFQTVTSCASSCTDGRICVRIV